MMHIFNNNYNLLASNNIHFTVSWVRYYIRYTLINPNIHINNNTNNFKIDYFQ